MFLKQTVYICSSIVPGFVEKKRIVKSESDRMLSFDQCCDDCLLINTVMIVFWSML